MYYKLSAKTLTCGKKAKIMVLDAFMMALFPFLGKAIL